MGIRYGDRSRVSTDTRQWGRTPQIPIVSLSESTSVTVQADASANTKGAWVEAIASTANATNLLTIYAATSASGTDTGCLLDVAIGPSGSEQIIVNNVAIGFSPGTNWSFPMSIPPGTRIALRLQHVTGSTNVAVRTTLTLLGDGTTKAVDTYGATTATSRGTNLPTSNTYVQLTASTTQPYRAVVMVATGGGLAAFANENSTYTLGIGGAGSEVDLFSATVVSNSSEFVTYVAGLSVPIYLGYIPDGSRLAVKQSVGRTYRDVILYGIPF